eukprot:Skav222179  [mRNA]  locus=scaffold3784:47182:48207:- [translate_table: standard]
MAASTSDEEEEESVEEEVEEEEEEDRRDSKTAVLTPRDTKGVPEKGDGHKKSDKHDKERREKEKGDGHKTSHEERREREKGDGHKKSHGEKREKERREKEKDRDRRHRSDNTEKTKDRKDKERDRGRSRYHGQGGRHEDASKSDWRGGKHEKEPPREDRTRDSHKGPVPHPKDPPKHQKGRGKSAPRQQCPHCGAKVAAHASALDQHTWRNVNCLAWQLYGAMGPREKKAEDAWEKATAAARELKRKRDLEAEVVRDPSPAVTVASTRRGGLRAEDLELLQRRTTEPFPALPVKKRRRKEPSSSPDTPRPQKRGKDKDSSSSRSPGPRGRKEGRRVTINIR